MTWNPATGVNDLEEIRRQVATRPFTSDWLDNRLSLALFHVPRLCDEVERLREENEQLREVVDMPIPDLACCGNCSRQHAVIRDIRSKKRTEAANAK